MVHLILISGTGMVSWSVQLPSNSLQPSFCGIRGKVSVWLGLEIHTKDDKQMGENIPEGRETREQEHHREDT